MAKVWYVSRDDKLVRSMTTVLCVLRVSVKNEMVMVAGCFVCELVIVRILWFGQ